MDCLRYNCEIFTKLIARLQEILLGHYLVFLSPCLLVSLSVAMKIDYPGNIVPRPPLLAIVCKKFPIQYIYIGKYDYLSGSKAAEACPFSSANQGIEYHDQMQ